MDSNLYRKYAGPRPAIFPPPPETEVEVKVPVEKEEIPEEWVKFQEFDPLTEEPSASPEEMKMELQEDAPPAYEKELLRFLNPEFHAGPETSTVPPKKKALTADEWVKTCNRFYDLCTK